MKITFILIVTFFLLNAVSASDIQKIYECKMEVSGKTIFILRSDSAHYLQFEDKIGTNRYFATIDNSYITRDDDQMLLMDYVESSRDRYSPSTKMQQIFIDKIQGSGYIYNYRRDEYGVTDQTSNFNECVKLN